MIFYNFVFQQRRVTVDNFLIKLFLNEDLKKHNHDLFQINGATGEKITNSQILKKAVSIARVLISKGARGKYVMIVMKNHQTMIAVYFATLFAGTVPFIMDPYTTVCKLF